MADELGLDRLSQLLMQRQLDRDLPPIEPQGGFVSPPSIRGTVDPDAMSALVEIMSGNNTLGLRGGLDSYGLSFKRRY